MPGLSEGECLHAVGILQADVAQNVVARCFWVHQSNQVPYTDYGDDSNKQEMPEIDHAEDVLV